ncbi:hypothetical protein GM661_14815 [Iocasia frigidifontis]|uniref:Porin n=1 Tax=Iocasia fonsfrigidae TaxID=2682810 RepID=A0A8A7KJW5_9FIRM|nr:hypothetical protein [Iocasia fonsfrigidae]QTL99137.1 hypothetical protein GM661_14815 [Iocasia fonsfrigidae]
MKKILFIGLVLILVLAFTSISLSAMITTTGELKFAYFMKDYSGADADYTKTELGLYNDIYIAPRVSANVNLWLETNGEEKQDYNIVDDAYVTYKTESGNNLQVGYSRFDTAGPTYALADFTRGLLGGDLEPAVNLVYTVSLNDVWAFQTGYFHNWGGNCYEDYTGGDGKDTLLARSMYSANHFNLNIMYLDFGEMDQQFINPAGEYMIDATYTWSKFSIYGAYIAYDWAYNSERDYMGIVGSTVSLGNFWLNVDYALKTPEESMWTEYQDGTWHETDWSKDKPLGCKVSYYFGNNTTLEYAYATNTAGSDKSTLTLIVKF